MTLVDAAHEAEAQRRRGAFHTLTVSSVEPITDDSAAIGFEVPEDLRRDYDFAAGQALTLRRTVDGVEQRRTYSICSPQGTSPRIGVREVPGGVFSRWLLREVRTMRRPLRTDGRSATREGRPLARSAGLRVRAASDRRAVAVDVSVTASPLWRW